MCRCQSSTGLGTLWIDMWVQLQSQDPAGVVLLDAYNGVLSLLRWTVYASGNSLFVKLTLLPDSQNVVVKTWGPIPSRVLGVWHHVCFTLRFGRLYSQTNPYPDAVLTQAFMFLDGSSVSEQGRNFLSLDMSNSLRLSQGISDIYIGGRNPAASEALKLFKGYIDNFRLWWPACPDLSDPSRCNPYAFLYPMDKTGKRTPAARDPVSGLPMQVLSRLCDERVCGMASVLMMMAGLRRADASRCQACQGKHVQQVGRVLVQQPASDRADV